MTPYMSLLLQPFLSILGELHERTSTVEELWAAVLSTTTKTLIYDEGCASFYTNCASTLFPNHPFLVVFWRDDRFKELVSPVVAQIAVAAHFNKAEASSSIMECLLALTEAVQSDTILKAINMGVLMHTRSEDARLRVLALTCSDALWSEHGGKLIGEQTTSTPSINVYLCELAS